MGLIDNLKQMDIFDHSINWRIITVWCVILLFSIQPVRAENIPHPKGCDIKGNISSKSIKIYHLPGSRSYSRTKISKSKERWFCNETEAKKAGWRASNSKKREKPTSDERDCQEPENHPLGKLIKGNTSSSGKIYHVLCSDFYFETTIEVQSGDKWFATIGEAEKAGWSKAGDLWRGKVSDTDLLDCQQPKKSHPKGCDIKGNISNGGKTRIYHVRGSSFYHETKIRTKAKERWFCNEVEAISAGWRRPKNFKRIVCPN